MNFFSLVLLLAATLIFLGVLAKERSWLGLGLACLTVGLIAQFVGPHTVTCC